MSLEEKKDFDRYINHHTVLYGDSNTGKTKETAMFLQYLIESGYSPREISVLDFAPDFTLNNSNIIGGKIDNFYKTSVDCNFWFKNYIIPPRLTSNNKKELKNHARHNYNITKNALKQYQNNPTSFLIINDISIFLHLGSVKRFLKLIKKARTFYGNAYYGTSIKSGSFKSFSRKEQQKVRQLIRKIEFSFYTG